MNRALPPGDRRYRSSDTHRPSPSSGIVDASRSPVLEVVEAVRRTEDPAERETPSDMNPAAHGEFDWTSSGFDGIAALDVLGLRRRDGQPHFLSHCTRHEPTHGMRLPTRSFHQFFQRGSSGPMQQIQHLGSLAAVAGDGGLLSGFGRVFGRTGLLGRLGRGGRDAGATCANACLFVRFRLGGRRRRLGGAGFLRHRGHGFSLRGDDRGHDMDHSASTEKQGKSALQRKRRWNGDGGSMTPGDPT
jgi:hypothetical protein